ncbi:MAG: peptide chain release factor 1 [Clostridia bacterium]|nr:peptide chain release factor 1 [Clostridia bacterium]
MFENLANVEERFDALEAQLADPDIVSDMKKYTALLKEHKQMTPVVETYRLYRKTESDLGEAKALLEDSAGDPELKELAREEADTLKVSLEETAEKLKVLLLPRDPNDDKNVIVEIRSGAGGEEAALFAGSLLRMYTMYAEAAGFKTEVLSSNPTELGGYKEVSFEITGDGAYSRFKFESGVHRVQRVPETESQGRIQTSTATVAVLPEADDVEFEINQSDLKIDTFRSSGAGGQHINKTDSAIRITHLPTGTVVECQDERSQHKNKERALKILSARLLEVEQQKHKDEIDSARRAQVGTGDRSERIRTYNFPQGRVSDHRIGLTLYKIDAIMNGNLDELIDALITADTAAKLEAAGNEA